MGGTFCRWSQHSTPYHSVDSHWPLCAHLHFKWLYICVDRRPVEVSRFLSRRDHEISHIHCRYGNRNGFTADHLHGERARLQSENLQRELGFLRSQVSPHFMFNIGVASTITMATRCYCNHISRAGIASARSCRSMRVSMTFIMD